MVNPYDRHMETTDALVAISTALTPGQILDLDLLARHDPGINSRAAQIRQAIATYLAREDPVRMGKLRQEDGPKYQLLADNKTGRVYGPAKDGGSA